jgi:hypothetical protein
MKSRALRSILLGMFVAATLGAAYLFWMGESKARAELEATRSFEAGTRSLVRAVLDLRNAQQAYVAAGQGEDFWASQVGALALSIRRDLGRLRNAGSSPLAQSHLDAAVSALQAFERMDRQARDHARNGQRLLASDLIFSEGLERTGTALEALELAYSAESDARHSAAAGARRRQWAAAAGIALFGLFTAIALVPLAPAPRPEPADRESDGDTARIAPPALPEPIFDLARDPRDGSWMPLRPSPGQAPAGDVPPLGEVASLCTELARVSEVRALPGALERAAALLDATGVVLWIADPDGRELNPIVSHGYSPQLVTRLGTIPRDAENATAAAFRTELVQTVDADAVSHGAIAAPLVTPTGCVGVMAAEVREGGEHHESKLAAATIVAAQLATLVGPPSARAGARTDVAGA